MKITNSVRFPIVTLTNAPVVSPMKLAISPVAWHRMSAKGMIAKQFSTKTTESLQPMYEAARPKGTKISMMRFQCLVENRAAAVNA